MGGLSRSANLLLMPILTRQFSVDEYGSIDILITMISLVALFVGLTLESAIARLWFDCARDGVQRNLVSSIIGFTLLIGSLTVAFIYYYSDWIVELLPGNTFRSVYIELGAVCAFLMALLNIPQIVIRMERRIVHYTILVTFQTASYVAIALFLILQVGADLLGVFVAMVIANGLALAVGLWLIRPYICLNLSISNLRSSLTYSIPLFPAVLVSWANPQVDRFILLTFLGLGAVGLYGAGAKIALILGILISTFQQAWTPLAVAAINDHNGRRDLYRRALNYYAGLMAMLGLILVTFSKELLALLVPADYQGAYIVIPWLIGAQILYGSACITNIGTLITKQSFRNSVAASIAVAINIAFSAFLVPRIGLWGAALGSLLAGLTFTWMLLLFSEHVTDVSFDKKIVLAIIAIYVFSSCALLFADELAHSLGSLFSISIRLFLLLSAIAAIGYLAIDRSAIMAFRRVQNLGIRKRPR